MERIKNLIIGFLIGCLLMTTTPVLANTILQKIEVALNIVSVEIEGQKLNETNILYKGITYLPMRAVAEAVGKDVEWNQNTMTANIKNKQEEVIGDNMNELSFTDEEYQDFVTLFDSEEQINDGDKNEITLFYNGNLSEDEIKQYLNIKNFKNRNEILKRIIDDKYIDTSKDLIIQYWYLKEDNTISLLGTIAKTSQGEYRIGFYNCDL